MADLLLMGVRFALFANLMLIAGLAAFSLYALGSDERTSGVGALFGRPQFGLCVSGLILSFAGMALLTASMQGVGVLAIDPEMFLTMVRETDVGTAWLVRMFALLVAGAASFWLGRNPVAAASVLSVAGSAGLATLVWSGHAGASEGIVGTVHRANDAIHMIAAAVWFGAIAAFLLLLRPGDPPGTERLALAARSLDQFARVGTLCVLVIAATGLVNSQIIIGVENVGRSIVSPYGQLLVAKLILFAAMLALAAVNRWRLTPALQASVASPDEIGADSSLAVSAMRRSLVLEASAGLAILALVAWFGTLEPFAD
ncbi:copper homeostasis membrane protein CopD [Sphingopyxis sp. L1A2A]|uniref:copper homeostasis membrane protein CopD n=1 Tax=Sphingopyxis sp. L1A2A TaxID=2502247 RepID=UPI0010F726EA|nr:copper homeostasis membrane protein CopD [Sphingopyxis sp. L1A2A]